LQRLAAKKQGRIFRSENKNKLGDYKNCDLNRDKVAK
jgi:hypothetical protein